LLETGYLVPIKGGNPAVMDIFSRDVLARIQRGEGGWDQMVSKDVAQLIKERRFFGCPDPALPQVESAAPVAAS